MDGGERRTQLFSWGTAPIENYEHWDWFAYQLLRQVGLARDYKEQKQEEQKGDAPGGEGRKGDGGEGRKGDGGKGQKGEGGEGKNPRPPPPISSWALGIFTDR
jgi:hypothetical protein